MSRIIRVIINTCIGGVIPYFATSFILNQFNPFNWHKEILFVTIGLSITCALISWIWYSRNFYSDKGGAA